MVTFYKKKQNKQNTRNSGGRKKNEENRNTQKRLDFELKQNLNLDLIQ